jgi:predicted TIM-barrel fold metal-dependent hydrolase
MGVTVNPEDLILISVDDHIAEPADMFAAHVPEKYRDQAPRVVVEANGVEQWYYGDVRGRNLGLNAVAGKPSDHYNIDANRYDEMRPGCYDVHERVRDMSAGGQLAGLNFPNWPGFSGQVLSLGPDKALNLVMIQAYNDWHVDEWCGAYPDRFIPCGLLPLFDAEAAAVEVRRLAAKGCHAITFSENPDALGMPSIHSRYWDPLFAACCDEGTVLCCHVGSSSRTAHTSQDAPPSVALTLSSVASIFTMVDLIWCDAFSRYPDLRFSLTEGDVGWIPYFLWRAEHVLDRHQGWTRHEFGAGITGPSEVFLRNILCCFIEEPVGIANLSSLNVDNLCWESDYPHSDGVWPNGPEVVARVMAGLDADVVDKITHGNAMRHYRFDPFATRPEDQCRAGVLRSEAADVDTVTRVGRPASDRDLEAWAGIAARVAGADKPAPSGR